MDPITLMGNSSASVFTALIALFLSFGLSMAVAWVYRKTHRGLSYSQSFVFTLVMLSVISAVLMIIIGSNLARAFGLVGAFSIIRFRTAIKDTKDIAYVFLALAIGMGAGTGHYLVILLATAFVLAIVFVLNKTNFGSLRKHEYLLSFELKNEQHSQQSFEPLFKKHLKDSVLLNIISKGEGRGSEMIYSINLVDNAKSAELVQELTAMPGVSRVNMITSKNDLEF